MPLPEIRRCLPAAATVALVACATPSDPTGDGADDETEIGTAVYVGAEEVRQYRPDSMLEVPATRVDRARFPAVDVHCHWSLDADPETMLRAMDDRNVSRAVNLSGGWGEDLDRMLARFHGASRDRFVIFCNIDFSRIDEPGFGETMTAMLADAKRKGATGLKIFKDLGLTIRDGSAALVAVDDPRLDPIWAACGELNMPVLIHTADPAAFFLPIDERNERWMQLRRHPTWSFYGDEFPSRAELFAQRDRMMARHRGTTFICAHLGSHAGDLAAAARLLETHPNSVLDISGRVAELGRQPYAARRLFLAHPNRILFATDRYPGRPDQPRYRIYFRFLETADEYFDYYDHPFPPTGEWKIYGIDLPDEVLRKVYHENADRILGGA